MGSIFSCKLYEICFSKFNERLLDLNHLFIYSNTVIMSIIKFVGLELVPIMLVSTVNKIGLVILNKLWYVSYIDMKGHRT
jgi:hypothetical protein